MLFFLLKLLVAVAVGLVTTYGLSSGPTGGRAKVIAICVTGAVVVGLPVGLAWRGVQDIDGIAVMAEVPAAWLGAFGLYWWIIGRHLKKPGAQ